MKVIHDLNEIYAQIDFIRRDGKRVGVVPTMGALHAGHLSLVHRAKQDCEIAVTTIFVNPTQFGPNDDLARYPRTLDSDLASLREHGCDFVFVPPSDRIYSSRHSTFVEPPAVARRWEGQLRPGHFCGVATIVLKLFQLIPAHVAYFGRKDYQQVAVIRAMVDDLNLPIRVEACETVREPDGLAMSSRNRYLSREDRVRAVGLWRALCLVQRRLDAGENTSVSLEAAMRVELEAAPVDCIDYAAIVHPGTMEPVDVVDESAVAIIAARVGSTRLIDNMTIMAKESHHMESSE